MGSNEFFEVLSIAVWPMLCLILIDVKDVGILCTLFNCHVTLRGYSILKKPAVSLLLL